MIAAVLFISFAVLLLIGTPIAVCLAFPASSPCSSRGRAVLWTLS